jgi:glycosyltransferase involved in cell wall biosynthesis
MKTSCLLTFICDPFHALLFRKTFENWKDEIDELVLSVSGEENQFIKEFIVNLFPEAKERVIENERLSQGDAYDRIYKYCTGDIIMTVDSDNYILKKGVVTKFKNMIGEYDVIGSTGLHATPYIADDIRKKFGFVRFNPFMSYWKRSFLEQIENLTWGVYRFNKGQKFPQVDYIATGDGHLDVMGLVGVQALQLGAKKFVIKPETGEYLHASGMSGAVLSHLGNGGRTVIGRKSNAINVPIPSGLLAWYLFAYLKTYEEFPDKKFCEEYYEALKRKIKDSHFTYEQIRDMAKKIEKDFK